MMIPPMLHDDHPAVVLIKGPCHSIKWTSTKNENIIVNQVSDIVNDCIYHGFSVFFYVGK